MSRLIRNKKLIGSTSNDSSHIIYDPSDTSRSETTVKSELDRLNAGIPAVDVGTATTDWTDTETATSAQGSDNYSTLNAMSPSSTIKSLLTSIKSLLFGLSTQVTSLNTNLSGLIKVVYDQQFTVSGTGLSYIDIYKDISIPGYTLVSVNVTPNNVDTLLSTRVRSNHILGWFQLKNGTNIGSGTTYVLGYSAVYVKNGYTN
jgi:hypothetical protein